MNIKSNKLLKKVISCVFTFLIIFLLANKNVLAAGFRYSDFDFDEFAEQNLEYWTRGCDENEPTYNKCVDKIIKNQKKYYTRLYNLLSSYQKHGYTIDDIIIITTTFYGYTPSRFIDDSNEEGIKGYNMDDESDNSLKNYNIDNEKEDKKYFEQETDTLKLLLKAMLGYEKTCYGISPIKEIVMEDGTIDRKCDNSMVGRVNGKDVCLTNLKTESISFWERFAENTGSFFGIKTKGSMNCTNLATQNGYSDGYVVIGTQKKVLEEGYWAFLEKGEYFDNKQHLRGYYDSIVEKAQKEDPSIKTIDDVDKEKYQDDFVAARKNIVESIKEIVKKYRETYTNVNLYISSNNTWWWPIGSIETTEKSGKTYADGDPVSVEITSKYGLRIHPVSKKITKHKGIDIGGVGNAGDTYVVASRAGTVSAVNTSCISSDEPDSTCGGGYGNYILILHPDGMYSLYAHLHENSITVKEGDSISQGEVIAKAGSSGTATGTHLHFEIRTGSSSDSTVDPLDYIDPANPRPKSGTLTFVAGETTKQEVCLSLKASGFSDDGIAGVMANINAESSFNPNSLGDNGTSYGLCQWHLERWDRLKAMYPSSWQTAEGQLNYLLYELETGYLSLYNTILEGTSSASKITTDYCLYFEVPANRYTVCPGRANNYASSMLSYVQNGCS